MSDSAFGKKLRELRIEAQKTVPDVSEYLKSVGIKAATQTIYGWERGHSSPPIDIFLEMCRFYGVTDVLSRFKDVPDLEDIISLPERALIKKYRLLDPYGKEAVDGVLDVEWRRCTAETAQEPSEPDNVIYIVRWYPSPMSAGTGTVAGDDSPEELELTKRPPRGTSYVAPVSGDSMEPTYHDGDKLFIRSCEEIENGQIGVFWMDGKQWVKEQGIGVLISHNPTYDPISMRDGIKCQGLVLGVCDESYFE